MLQKQLWAEGPVPLKDRGAYHHFLITADVSRNLRANQFEVSVQDYLAFIDLAAAQTPDTRAR
jgi:hypothetical protein